MIRNMGHPVYVKFAPIVDGEDRRWMGFATSNVRADIVVEIGYVKFGPGKFYAQGWGDTIAEAVTRAWLAVAEGKL